MPPLYIYILWYTPLICQAAAAGSIDVEPDLLNWQMACSPQDITPTHRRFVVLNLIGGFNTSEKYDFVSSDDDYSQYMET